MGNNIIISTQEADNPDLGVKVVTVQIPGLQGADGPQGPQGAAGPANVLTIGTVTTGAAGSSASATITGASPNQVLNLTIPRGTDGTDGAGLAAGGALGDVPIKLSATDFDIGWSTPASAATASTLMKRDANGRAQVADPSAAADIATKNYADTKASIAGDIGGTAASPQVISGTHHTHTSSQISDAASAATVNVVVKRDAAGRASVADPSASTDISTKNYTDTQDLSMRRPTVNTQTANYTLVLTDERKIVQINSATTVTLTVPTNASVAFPVGTVIDVQMFGAGSVAITPAGAVTLNSANSAVTMTRQNSMVRLIKYGTDSWAVREILLASATASSTANTLILRDSNGRASVADPSASTDIATKNYADTKASIAGDLGGTAASPQVTSGTHHSHTSSQISDAASASTANVVMKRDANGRASVADPSASTDIATKNYVDTKAIYPTPVSLTDGVTIATDASLGKLFRVTVAGNRTMSVPTNPTDGQRIMYEVTASGADRTLTLSTSAGGFKFGTDFTSIPTIASGTTTYIGCMYSSRDSFWHVLAVGSGH